MVSGATVAVMMAVLATGPASANDRDLRATTVSAYSCTTKDGGIRDNALGIYTGDITNPNIGADAEIVLRCPLPLNNIDLGGTSNDNDISDFTVFYQDEDGLGNRVAITVDLNEVRLVSGRMVSAVKCSWNSNVNASGSTSYSASNLRCPVDLVATGFYHFTVRMAIEAPAPNSGLNTIDAAFAGIRFP